MWCSDDEAQDRALAGERLRRQHANMDGAGRRQPRGDGALNWPRHWQRGRKERCIWVTARITKSKKVEAKHLTEVAGERVTAIHCRAGGWKAGQRAPSSVGCLRDACGMPAGAECDKDRA